MIVERVGVSSSPLVTRKRMALHQELSSSEYQQHQHYWGDNKNNNNNNNKMQRDPQECSDVSSNASSTSTTLLDPGLGHVHHWNISDDPIDLVIHFQRHNHHHQRRRSNRRIPPTEYNNTMVVSPSPSPSLLTPVVLDHPSFEETIATEQQAPLLLTTTSNNNNNSSNNSSSPAAAEEDEYHLVLSTLHRFGMFDTPQRLRYWSESSTPDLPRVVRTMLGIFIVILSFIAFCALVSSRYFSSSGRQIHPVIRMLRRPED